MIALRILSIVVGVLVVGLAVGLAMRTFMLPRAGMNIVVRLVLRGMQHVFWLAVSPLRSSPAREAVLALYAPICLILIVAVSLTAIGLGSLFVFWGLGAPSLRQAYVNSGSSLSTLGFAQLGDDLPIVTTAVVEAGTAATILALLIGYLPTIYAAYQQREQAIAALEAEVGHSASGVAILERYDSPAGLDHDRRAWKEWTRWFVTLGTSHSSLTGILFVRSPRPSGSWVATAGAVLDAAALAESTIDRPADLDVDRCLTIGVSALHQILDAMHVRYPLDPRFPETPIGVSRQEFDQACASLERAGIRVRADREEAWREFVKRRVRYDAALVALFRLTMVPEAAWSGDRPAVTHPLYLPIRRDPDGTYAC